MSAFEGTPLAVLLRDLGLVSFLVAGIALEIGIEPTVRHGADLGFIPVVVQDACGFGNAEAAQRSLAAMQFTGDAILTDVAPLCAILDARARGS
jgi:biuret amidohydrolase